MKNDFLLNIYYARMSVGNIIKWTLVSRKRYVQLLKYNLITLKNKYESILAKKLITTIFRFFENNNYSRSN